MNKADLINEIAQTTNITKKDAETAITAAMEIIIDALRTGDRVQLIGFGTFEVKKRSERLGRNLHTGEEIIIPAARIPHFKAGKVMKDAVAAAENTDA